MSIIKPLNTSMIDVKTNSIIKTIYKKERNGLYYASTRVVPMDKKNRSDKGKSRKIYKRRPLTADLERYRIKYSDQNLFDAKKSLIENHHTPGVFGINEIAKIIMSKPNIDLHKSQILLNL